MEFRYQDASPVRVDRVDGEYQITIGGRVYRVQVLDAGPGDLALLIDGQRVHAQVADQPKSATMNGQKWIALNGVIYTLRRAEAASRTRAAQHADHKLTATMPGQVIKLLVGAGDNVKRGQALLVLEAMKMEVRLNAPHDGIVKRLLCAVGQVVERDQPLVEFE
jgi:biotin carboxyl carrier protein